MWTAGMWRVQGRSHWSLLYSNNISIPNQPVKSQQHVLFSDRYWSHACVYPKSILHTKSKPLIYSVDGILNMPHAQCVCYVHIFCNTLCRNVDEVLKFEAADGSLLWLKTGKVHPFIYPVCVCVWTVHHLQEWTELAKVRMVLSRGLRVHYSDA